MPSFTQNKFSTLPPPPKDKSGAITDDQYKNYLKTLPPPPNGAQGISDEEMRNKGHDMNVNNSAAALSNATDLNLKMNTKGFDLFGNLNGQKVEETGAGQSIGDALYANHAQEITQKIGEDKSKMAMALVQRIHDDRTAGKDVSKLEKTYQEIVGEKVPDLGQITPSVDKTGRQIAGEFGELGAQVLSGAEVPDSLLGQIGQFAALGGAGSGSHALATGADNQTALKETGKGALFGGALGGILGGIGKGISKLFGPAKAFDPAIGEAFQEEGIKAPISALNTSRFTRGAEALTSKGLFGKDIVDLATNAVNELNQKTENLVSKIRPDKIMSDAATGSMLQEGLKEFEDNFKLTEGKIYDEFSKTYGKSNVFGMKTKDALNTILNEPGQGYFKNVDPRLQRLLNKITGANDPELKALEGQISELKASGANESSLSPLQKELESKQAEVNKNVTFEELKNVRTDVGEAINKEPENSELKRLYGALSEDMHSAVAKIASESKGGDTIGAMESLDKLNEAFRTGKSKIESNIAQSISKSNPEQIAQNLIKRNNSNVLSQVKEMVGPERFDEVKKTFVRDLFDKSITREKFDITKFKKNMGNYDQATLDTVIPPNEQKNLSDAIVQFEKYQKMGEALKSGAKMSEGSQTAFLTRIGNLFTKTGAAIPALLSGNVGLLLALGSETGLEYGMSKFLLSDVGRKILTEGLNMNNVELLKNAGLSAAQIGEVQNAIKNNQVQN